MKTALLLAVGISGVLVSEVRASEPDATNRTPVEHITKIPPRDTAGLGTMEYRPSDKERPFFVNLDPQERKTGGLAGDYNIATKAGKYVGWFGIVRGVSEDAAAQRTTLLVEHKYFDGLTDAHIMALSFNGSGDFRAVLRGVGHGIARLTLVKVYGKVSAQAHGELPRVNAVYVRNWHWGTFTFLAAHGTQRGSEQWRKLNRIDLDRLYDPDPDDAYYEQRLGKRPSDDPLYRRLLEPAGKLTPEAEKDMIELVDSLRATSGFPFLRVIGAIENRHEQRAAVAVLRAAILDKDDIPPGIVCDGLARLGGSEEVQWLVSLLRDASPELRRRAAYTLSCMRRKAAPAAGALIEAMRDAESTVRAGAANALGSIGAEARAAEGPLKAALKDRDGHVRVAAAEALWEITSQPESAVPVLIAALKDADADVRSCAAGALERIGPEAKAAGPALIEATKDKEQFVRYSAVQTLGAIRPELKSVVPALAAALKDEDHYVRAQAADALSRYGSAAQSAVPALVAALKDESDYVRWQSASALGEIGPAAAKAVPALIEMLRHDTYETARCSAAEALGSIDAEGRTAVTALIEGLRDPSAYVRRSSAFGLRKIGSNAKGALPALRVALKDNDVGVRVAAAEAAWKAGCDPETVVPVLAEALTNKNWLVQMWAANAVRTVGPAAKTVIPRLIVVFRDDTHYAQNSAARALGALGPEAVAAVPALVEKLRTKEGSDPVAVDAAEALWNINRDARSIPALTKLLAVEDCRVPAAEALGRIGSAAREAVPALRELTKNRDGDIRRAATEALRKLNNKYRTGSTP